jgi:crotonobetaine/carnitine-CoA ligase
LAQEKASPGLGAVDLIAAPTVSSALESAVAEDPKRPFIRFSVGGWLSVGDVQERSLAIAGFLQRQGLGRGDRLALMMENVPGFVYGWFAAARLGAVIVPINTHQRGMLLQSLLARIRPRAIIASAKYSQVLPPSADGEIRLIDDTSGLERLVTARRAGVEPAALGRLDPMAILFTSGTTGISKGVVLSHGHYIKRSTGFARGLRIQTDDVIFTCLPLFHSNAQMQAVMTALLTRARTVVYERFSVSRFWKQIVEAGATRVTLLPRMANQLLAAPLQEDEMNHRLRTVSIGPTPRGWDRFRDRFAVLVTSQHYGSTECIPMPPNLALESRPGSCGKPGPGFDCRLVDPTGREVAEGETGELLVRCDDPAGLFSGYFEMPEATAAALQAGWYHTGDAFRRDGDGYYYFEGRLKDFIRHKGENISIRELESVVEMHPAVDTAAAVGVADEWGEEQIVLYVEPSNLGVRARGVLEFCERELPDFMVPASIRLVRGLPRNVMGRVEKHRLGELALIDEAFAGFRPPVGGQ